MKNEHGVTRRSFLAKAAALGAVPGTVPGLTMVGRAQTPSQSFLDLRRVPDLVTLYTHFEKTLPTGRIPLERHGDRWTSRQAAVQTNPAAAGLTLTLAAPSIPIALVHLRWFAAIPADVRVLGDAWERSYGDLGWRNLIPERVMPWYVATFDGAVCHGYGVKTGARALCFWQLDREGVSLWLNVANGGEGVLLAQRELPLATVVSHRGQGDEDVLTAMRALCRTMCARPSRLMQPIYGANDWCYAYGGSTARSILRDTEFIAELSPSAGARPFSVIDGGWSEGTPAWPDMGALAREIKARTARPGLWVRPLEAPPGTPRALLLPDTRFGERSDRARELAYDPTVPEAREKIAAKLKQAAAWGYEMVKHDFTTYDLLGQWGFEMGPRPTLPGWSLADRGRTNAEIISDLYALIRENAGEPMLLDGCNTIGHLGQGIFDLQRTGDDTSGRQWERTRRMGINTLAFRLPQHGSFFTLDADVVGLTEAISWELNRQWLDVLARSGTATLVSAGPPARGPEQRAALREAFAIAAAGGLSAQPIDWLQTGTPAHWRTSNPSTPVRHYLWDGPDGASPFLSP